jgi:hypothetical protein
MNARLEGIPGSTMLEYVRKSYKSAYYVRILKVLLNKFRTQTRICSYYLRERERERERETKDLQMGSDVKEN